MAVVTPTDSRKRRRRLSFPADPAAVTVRLFGVTLDANKRAVDVGDVSATAAQSDSPTERARKRRRVETESPGPPPGTPGPAPPSATPTDSPPASPRVLKVTLSSSPPSGRRRRVREDTPHPVAVERSIAECTKSVWTLELTGES